MESLEKISQKQSKMRTITQIGIIILSILGLSVCIGILFPTGRQSAMDLIGWMLHRKITYPGAFLLLRSLAMGGIFLILFFDYCVLTYSGNKLVQTVKQEIKDCLSEINFRNLQKPVLLMFGVYLLGISTIIRANFLYQDDLHRAIEGSRLWYDRSRYVSELVSIFVHGDTHLTDISPLPQLLAVLILSISSVILVYVMGNRKITAIRLLASFPLGLSPFFLECISFKFDAPYMALSVLAGIVPFLFITRKKAFLFCSVVCLLIMCMTYQASSGIYLLIAIILCFQDWNSREKPDREILTFLGMTAIAFCFAILSFRFFLMKPTVGDYDYAQTTTHPLPYILQGTFINIKNYAITINQDFGMIWKIGIALVCILFLIKSVAASHQKKALSLLVSISVIAISFILSYGVYSFLSTPMYNPRSLLGFGVLLSILCVYVVADYKRIGVVIVLALNWCFLVFAFSYGNAMADQARYAEFRAGILFHDLSALYPNRNNEILTIQIDNSIEYTPSVKNIAKHYPVIEKLLPTRFGDRWDVQYLRHFNHHHNTISNLAFITPVDFNTLNLPVVLDSYYHTIKSDGTRCLVILKH